MRAGPWAVVLAGLSMLVACGRPPTYAAPASVELRFTTGPHGGGFHPFGQMLAERFEHRPGTVRLNVRTSPGAVANLRAIQSNQADIGFGFADVAYLASIGRLVRGAAPFDQVRAIAVLHLTPVQFVARAGSGIDSIRDLRGRVVAIGPEGSGTAYTARLILEAFDIPLSTIRTESLSFTDAGAKLVAGTVDAMFELRSVEPNLQRALGAGARLIPIEGSPVELLQREYPFIKATVVPRDTNAGNPAVRTIGVDSLLVCRGTLDESVVYELTSGLFDVLPSLSPFRPFRLAEFDEAPTAPIPLHQGAARYYREQELLR